MVIILILKTSSHLHLQNRVHSLTKQRIAEGGDGGGYAGEVRGLDKEPRETHSF